MTHTAPSATSGGLKVWLMAARPKTLSAGVVPIAVGTALAHAHGKLHVGAAVASLVVALLIQIGTNLANDYFDFKSGADDEHRLGPVRVTSAGLVSPAAIAAATALIFALAFVAGLYLVWLAGWPLLVLGIICILSGVAYTGGPFPLAYNALGDVFVFVFFGLIATAGTYYTQAQVISPLALWFGAAVGLHGTALLIVNNLRDIDSDRQHRKITTAVLLGPKRTRAFYALAAFGAYVVPIVSALMGWTGPAVLLALLTVPLAVANLKALHERTGAALNAVLARTALLQLTTGALLALGIAL